jgi:hypothetical protein
MKEIVSHYLAERTLGEPQAWCNLAMVPLLGEDAVHAPYLLLDEALDQGVLFITEKDEAGSVPELRVENASDLPVLVLDGEELVGARQNRVVNTTLLLAAASTTVIPVSCVEQGRWSYDTPAFRSEKRMMNADLRAMKAGHVHASLSRERAHRSDQGALWHGIADMAERRRAFSPSGAMSAIHNEDRSLVRDYEKAFHPVPGQIGALFLLNGHAAGLDAFGRHETLSRVFSKLLRSYALDAVDRYDPPEKPPSPETEARAFLEACTEARVEAFPAVGLGQDGRLSSVRVVGFALALEGQVLHLSAFSRSGAEGSSRTRMHRFSQRRSHAERA